MLGRNTANRTPDARRSAFLARSEREIAQATEWAQRFNREVLSRAASAVDAAVARDPRALPQEWVTEAWRRGFYSRWLPRVFGGGGYGAPSLLAFTQVVAEECLGAANLIASHYVGFAIVSATFNLRALRLLCRDVVAGGEPRLVSTAITEPDAGSDMEDPRLLPLARVGCRAERVDGGYRLTGSKAFISNAPLAKWHVVTAFSERSRPADSGGVFLVSSNSPGLSIGRIERKLGQAACPAAALHLDSVFVPSDRVCLAPPMKADQNSHRERIAMLTQDVLAISRPGVAAQAAGVARGALRDTLSTLEHAPGKPLDREWAQLELAEIEQSARTCELLWRDAVAAVSVGGPFADWVDPRVSRCLRLVPASFADLLLGRWIAGAGTEAKLRERRREIRARSTDREYSATAAGAKFAASELATESCERALELTGIEGALASRGIEKRLRDARLLKIYEGPNDLNRIALFLDSVLPGGAAFEG